jgi:2-methylisocitrate lyase-like PEP mutase family enzyme
MTTSQQDDAKHFRDLHYTGRVLVLPNVWDVVSARLVEQAGAAAIATTSAGAAWSLGARDGDQLGRDRAVQLVARVAAAVGLPVTADVEGGYAGSAAGVGLTVSEVIEAGAVGVNLEDWQHGGSAPLRPVGEQADRIAAARQAADAAGVPLFVNARVDVYLRQVGEPDTRLPSTVQRAAAYLAAGADGIFVPGVTDLAAVASLVKEVPAPLNILAHHGAPAVGEFGALGVARVSVGASLAEVAYTAAQRAATELLTEGTYSALAGALTFGELDTLLS